MKKITLFVLLFTGISYGVKLEMFTEFTRKNFETKFNRVHHRLQNENISTESGIAKVYCLLCSKKLEEAFADQKAYNCMNSLYMEIKDSAEFKTISERLKKAKTEESFDCEGYAYWVFVLEKAQKMLARDCPGIEITKPFSVDDTREWMMIDYPAYFRLNANKEFDDTCTSCVLGVNAIISLMAQEMYEMEKKNN